VARPANPDLIKPWKIHLPATIAGRVEWALMDPVHCKPKYAARGKLLVALLERWIAQELDHLPEDQLPQIPSLEELRAI